MNKTVRAIAIVLALAIPASACTTNLGSVLSAITNPIKNPITKKEVAQVSAAYGAVQVAFVTYKRWCVLQVSKGDKSCIATVKKLRTIDAQANAALDALEDFVRAHPTLDASAYYDAATKAIAIAKAAIPNTGV